jgi:hypothetical protein
MGGLAKLIVSFFSTPTSYSMWEASTPLLHGPDRSLQALNPTTQLDQPNRRLNAFFSIVLDTVDRSVDRVSLHQNRVVWLEHGLKVSDARGWTEPPIIVLRHQHDGHTIMHADKWVRFPLRLWPRIGCPRLRGGELPYPGEGERFEVFTAEAIRLLAIFEAPSQPVR